jgi:glycosyltransferase involved in cell wall biosynthesis
LSLRILFAADVPPDPNSGAAGTELRTIEALRERGHDVQAIWAQDLGRRIQHGNLHYLLELPSAYRRVIGERCKRQAFDVIHANQGHSYAAARAHAQEARPGVFVCRSHGLDDRAERFLAPWRNRLGVAPQSGVKRAVSKGLNQLLQRHDRLAYKFASGVLVSSSVDSDYLVHDMNVPEQRVGCVAQAPADAFCAAPAPPMGLQRLSKLLHVGGFAYFKGVHAIAGAANDLLAEDASLNMTWVCRTQEHESVRALLAPTLRRRVDLQAWVSQEQLVQILDEHGIFLMPSLFEGFGKLFLEAMARGMCVIGTPTGGMRDIIEPGRNGLLVGFNDPAGIASAVRLLRASGETAAAMSAAASNTARRYSWARMGAEVEAFYDRLLALGPRHSPY